MKNKHYFQYGIIPALLIGVQTVQGFANSEYADPNTRELYNYVTGYNIAILEILKG